jgi:DNA repair exonuclease SbcCD ATPase subunit
MNRLRWIEIENFRGFAEQCRIDLDADAIIITGANGSGKTSLIDAIAWGLTGAIERLESRRERRGDDVLSNRYRKGGTPRVTLAFSRDDGAEVEAIREPAGNASSLTLRINGSITGEGSDGLAQALGLPDQAGLRHAVETWGVLHQDSVRAVLETRPDEFQQRLREILGLGLLDDFEGWLKSENNAATQDLNDARRRLAQTSTGVERARRALQGIEERVAQTPGNSLYEALLEAIQDASPRLVVRIPDMRESSVSPLLQEVRRLQVELSRQWSARAATEEALSSAIDRITEVEPDSLIVSTAAATAAYEAAQSAYEQAEANLNAMRRDLEGLAALAAAALPHLSDHCPVCDQTIDEAHVRGHLQSLIDQTGDLPNYAALRAARDTAQTQAQQAELALGEAIRRERLELDSQQRLSQLRAELDASTRWFEQAGGESEVIPLKLEPLDAEAVALAENDLRRLEAALQRWQNSLADQAALMQEPAERARLAEAEAQQALLIAEVERLASAELALESLGKAATKAVVDVTTQWLAELNPLFGAVYNRLAAHPTFSELGLEHDVYYGKGRTLPRVYDRLIDIGDNPLVVCSEGQLNIVALSYFVAFGLSAGQRRLPFMIMDDPLQFMDEVNVLGFADLCRHLRSERQIVVTTHDRRFARLLDRKLRPRLERDTSIFIEFDSWDRSGPTLLTTRHTAVEVPEILSEIGA